MVVTEPEHWQLASTATLGSRAAYRVNEHVRQGTITLISRTGVEILGPYGKHFAKWQDIILIEKD